ncbi:hypothetical protein sync_2445 [Synechococcus sp. CC9311]|nr:hypothetical protein sync_2445 [Synechococcus sp. CC9311]
MSVEWKLQKVWDGLFLAESKMMISILDLQPLTRYLFSRSKFQAGFL